MGAVHISWCCSRTTHCIFQNKVFPQCGVGFLKRPIWLSCGNATILPSAQMPPTSSWASLAVNDTSPPVSYLHQYQLLLTISPPPASLCSQPCPRCMGYSGTFYPLLPQLHPSTSLKHHLTRARLVSPWDHFFDGCKHKFCIQVH